MKSTDLLAVARESRAAAAQSRKVNCMFASSRSAGSTKLKCFALTISRRLRPFRQLVRSENKIPQRYLAIVPGASCFLRFLPPSMQ